MTQFLQPLTSLIVSGSWGLVGAPTYHEAVDEGIATSDGNATYIQGSSGLGVIDFDMTAPIECGGVRSGFAFTMRARRVGAMFNPANEPKLTMSVFRGTDPTVIASANFDFQVGANIFTDYVLSLTALQAAVLWPPNTLAVAPRVRLDLTFCLVANTIRVTTLEGSLPDPLIIPTPAHMVMGFGQLSPLIASTGGQRASVRTAGGVGLVGVAGGRGMVSR